MSGSAETLALAQLDAAVDALAAVVPADRGAWAAAMQRCLSKVDAVATRAARDFDANGDTEGAASSGAWLAHRSGSPRHERSAWSRAAARSSGCPRSRPRSRAVTSR